MVQSITPPATEKKRVAAPVRALLKGLALAACVVFVAEALRIFVGSNFHTVVPGKCYRAAQPSPAFLADMKTKYGIHSIVNLRDENKDDRWYVEEKQAAEDLHITLNNAGLWSTVQPLPDEFQRFVKTVKEAEEPVLIHCANGNDRSGLASAVYLLLRTDTPLAEARGQLSLRYGHIPWSKAACLQRVLGSYETWLNGKEHRPEQFYTWAMTVYRPEPRP
jgi:protein tyrosine/serine phosphatase